MNAEFRAHMFRTYLKHRVPGSVLKTVDGMKWFVALCVDSFAQLSRRRLAKL